MARTPSTMLNIRGGSKHPCFFPDFKVNAYNFCPLSMMLAVGLSYIALIMHVSYFNMSFTDHYNSCIFL